MIERVGHRHIILEAGAAHDIPDKDAVRTGIGRLVLEQVALDICNGIRVYGTPRLFREYGNTLELVEVPAGAVAEPPHDAMIVLTEDRCGENTALLYELVREVLPVNPYGDTGRIAGDLEEGIANLPVHLFAVNGADEVETVTDAPAGIEYAITLIVGKLALVRGLEGGAIGVAFRTVFGGKKGNGYKAALRTVPALGDHISSLAAILACSFERYLLGMYDMTVDFTRGQLELFTILKPDIMDRTTRCAEKMSVRYA